MPKLSKSTVRKFNKLYEAVLDMKLHIDQLELKQTLADQASKHPKKIQHQKLPKRGPGRPRKA